MSTDNAIVQLDAARHALAACRTVMEAKHIADAAEAARVYLERTNASAETVNEATEIRLLAERQMGAFLKSMPKNDGGRPKETGRDTQPVNECPATLKEMGLTKDQSARAQKLAAIPADEFAERIEAAKDDGKLTTAAVLNPSAEPIDLGDGIELMNTPASKHWMPAPQFSAAAMAAGKQAEKESEALWLLKSTWRKTNKKDRAAFIEWAHQTT